MAPATPASIGDKIGVCSISEYLTYCKSKKPISNFVTLQEKLVEWLKEPAPEGYRSELGLLASNGKVLRAYANVCLRHGIVDTKITSLYQIQNDILLYTKPSEKYLDWLIENQETIFKERDEDIADNLVAYLEQLPQRIHTAALTGTLDAISPSSLNPNILLSKDPSGKTAIRIAAETGHLTQIEITPQLVRRLAPQHAKISSEIQAGMRATTDTQQVTSSSNPIRQWQIKLLHDVAAYNAKLKARAQLKRKQ